MSITPPPRNGNAASNNNRGFDHKGLHQAEVTELLARWMIEAAESGQDGDLLFLLDTDGSMTYKNSTGMPWEDDDYASRVHPWIARALIAISRAPGQKARTSSGGKAERTAVVYEGSHLAGVVDADCGYGTEQVTWTPSGRPTITSHTYATHVESLWKLAAEYLNADLKQRYGLLAQQTEQPVSERKISDAPTSTENWYGQVVWFDLKGTHVSVHDHGSGLVENGTALLPGFYEAIRESLERFLRSDRLAEWLHEHAADPNWGPRDPNDRAELLGVLRERIEIHPMNAGWEVVLDLGLHKDTVLVERSKQYGSRHIVTISDDLGDRKGLNKLRELRSAGQLDGLAFAAVYPSDSRGRRTNAEVRRLVDYELIGDAVPGEASKDFLREPVQQVSAQGLFGIILTNALIQAVQTRPDLFPESVIQALNTPVKDLYTLSPHPRGIDGPVTSSRMAVQPALSL